MAASTLSTGLASAFGLLALPARTAEQASLDLAVRHGAAAPADGPETPFRKVFRLVDEKRYDEAARAVKKIVDAGGITGFFIYGNTTEYRRAADWFNEAVRGARGDGEAGFDTITPYRAQILLEGNKGNRLLVPDKLAEYMRDMANGQWSKNGEPIIVSREGLLNDGQHRLIACLLLGSKFRSLIVWGVERESRKTVDVGGARGVADSLRFDGIADPKAKSAATNLYFRILFGRRATKREEYDFYHNNSLYIDKAHDVVASSVRGAPLTSLRVAALHLLLTGEAADDLESFFVMIRRGDKSRSRACPAYSLHKAIAIDRLPLPREHWVFATIHHYRTLRAGKPLGPLTVPQSLDGIGG